MDKRYIGDGVYVEYNGLGLILTTKEGEHTTNRIQLEPFVFDALRQFNLEVIREMHAKP